MNSSTFPDIIMKEQLQIKETDAKSRKRKIAMGEYQLKNDKVECTFDMPSNPLLDSPSTSECVSPPNTVEGDSHSVFIFKCKDFFNNIYLNTNSPAIINPFIAFNYNLNKQENIFDIFFSIRCSPAMIKLATAIKNELERNYGYTVFLCTDNAKTTFYDQINGAIMKCSFFVPYIDFDWCKSNECGDEKNTADNLSKHSEPRKPVIIPIVFIQDGVLDHVRCKPLTSTWDSIFVDMNHVDKKYIYDKLLAILRPKNYTK